MSMSLEDSPSLLRGRWPSGFPHHRRSFLATRGTSRTICPNWRKVNGLLPMPEPNLKQALTPEVCEPVP